MNLTNWFCERLRTSAEAFVWGAELVPGDRLYLRPPSGLGEWPAARHVFHLAYYELTYALPTMGQWLGQPRASVKGPGEETAWGMGRPMAELLASFREVRDQQVDLLRGLEASSWQETRDTFWGPVTLEWVVGKTFQHTAEHTSEIMRIALFWDFFAGR